MTHHTGSGEYEFEHPCRDGEMHILRVELEVERGHDSVPYGSTYVSMPWADVTAETWYLDGLEIAEWALDYYLAIWGFSQEQIKELKDKTNDRYTDD